MRLTVNGTEHEVAAPPLTTLLHVLREELFVTSPKAGCQQGGCGACTVLVDGEPRRSCLIPLAAVEGAAIATVEGLGEADELSPVQAAFHDRRAQNLHPAVFERGRRNVQRIKRRHESPRPFRPHR